MPELLDKYVAVLNAPVVTMSLRRQRDGVEGAVGPKD